jgi:hypothetical protein
MIYYVYVYLDPLFPNNCNYENYKFDHTPIYIGKGKNRRCDDHLKKTNNPIFVNKIAYWKRNNIKPIIIKLQENISEIDAWALEIKLIKEIGRFDLGLGPLLNLTDGGEGPSNREPYNKGKKGLYVTSEETKNKIKLTLTGKPKPVDHGRKVSAALKGKPKSAEHRKKLSEANIGHEGPNKGVTGIWTEEQLKAQSKKMKEWWTVERRLEKSEQLKGKKLSDEHKANLAAAMVKARKPHSEETKLKMSESRRLYWQNRKNPNEVSKKQE